MKKNIPTTTSGINDETGKANTKKRVTKAKKISGAKKNHKKVISPKKLKKIDSLNASVALPMTQGDCIIWRDTEVSQRIRQAISDWSGVPLASITSAATLEQLANTNNGSWDIGQQNNLINAVNNTNPPIFHSIVPEDDICQMDSLPALQPGATTVLTWEGIVWRHQNPDCFCKFQYAI